MELQEVHHAFLEKENSENLNRIDIPFEKKDSTKKYCCGCCCISTIYVCCFLSFLILGVFIVGGISSVIFSPNIEITTKLGRFQTQFGLPLYLLDEIGIEKIYPLVIPAVICFVIGAILLCWICLVYCCGYCLIWKALCLGKSGIKYEQNTSEQTANEYMEQLTKTETKGMGLNVRCTHRERRVRYVTRRSGKHRRRVRKTYHVTITTFNQDFPLNFQTCKDTSKIPNLKTSSSNLIDLKTNLLIQYEKETLDYMKRYQSYLYEQNKHRDANCIVTFLNPTIEGIKKEFKFSKNGRIPYSLKVIMHPFKSLYGCFLMCTCLICCTRIIAVDRFQKVKFEVTKVLGRSKENLKFFPGQTQEYNLQQKMIENQRIIEQQQQIIQQQGGFLPPPQLINTNPNNMEFQQNQIQQHKKDEEEVEYITNIVPDTEQYAY